MAPLIVMSVAWVWYARPGSPVLSITQIRGVARCGSLSLPCLDLRLYRTSIRARALI